MHQLQEWTASDYTKDTKVLRGGSWYDSGQSVRAAYRLHARPDVRYDLHGFRCVVEPGSWASGVLTPGLLIG